jgi:hypothetical protein
MYGTVSIHIHTQIHHYVSLCHVVYIYITYHVSLYVHSTVLILIYQYTYTLQSLTQQNLITMSLCMSLVFPCAFSCLSFSYVLHSVIQPCPNSSVFLHVFPFCTFSTFSFILELVQIVLFHHVFPFCTFSTFSFILELVQIVLFHPFPYCITIAFSFQCISTDHTSFSSRQTRSFSHHDFLSCDWPLGCRGITPEHFA